MVILNLTTKNKYINSLQYIKKNHFLSSKLKVIYLNKSNTSIEKLGKLYKTLKLLLIAISNDTFQLPIFNEKLFHLYKLLRKPICLLVMEQLDEKSSSKLQKIFYDFFDNKNFRHNKLKRLDLTDDKQFKSVWLNEKLNRIIEDEDRQYF